MMTNPSSFYNIERTRENKREQERTRENKREQERTRENKREQERTRENKREQERTRENYRSHKPDVNYRIFYSYTGFGFGTSTQNSLQSFNSFSQNSSLLTSEKLYFGARVL